MAAIMDIASRFELRVIEDAAQAIGSEDAQGRRACSIGDIGCLSFFPTKNLGAFGDAGMCVTNDAELAGKLEILRVHGGKPKYFHKVIGGNFRLDEIQAAVLNVKLPHLDSWTAARQRNAAFYDAAFKRAGLGSQLVTPPAAVKGRHIYPLALHMQECFAYLGHSPQDFPESARAAQESLALPIYPELAEAQLQYVVSAVTRFYGG
jgi:dTDP-4-amino-4,6-dideoxygalactose transaminase